MDRTLHYDVFGDLEQGPVPPTTRQEILRVQQTMNRELTWTTENLSLDLFGACQVTYPAKPPYPWAPRIGAGSTMVRDDEWNAALVLRFLRWVSTRLPSRAFVRVSDEGDDLLMGSAFILGGELMRDASTKVAPALPQGFVRNVPASLYAERGEILVFKQTLAPDEFARLTLDEAAARLCRRWLRKERGVA